jgi:prevent-host-death family protein
MLKVNMLDAKTRLSRLVEAVESGAEPEIIIARNGKPAAKLVPVDAPAAQTVRIGIAEGMYPSMSLEDFNAHEEEIAALFYQDDL